MRAHGLVSLADCTHRTSRRTKPIADVLALGHCPTIAVDCVRSLCLALAPHLRTTAQLPQPIEEPAGDCWHVYLQRRWNSCGWMKTAGTD